MYFNDYFEEVLELSQDYEITEDEIIYNKDFFENCYENQIQPSQALDELEKECL